MKIQESCQVRFGKFGHCLRKLAVFSVGVISISLTMELLADPPAQSTSTLTFPASSASDENRGSDISIESHNPPKTLPPTLPGTTSTVTFGVAAVDFFGIPIPNYDICHRLESTVDDNARAGHQHHDQQKPVGQLNPPNGGNTGSTGVLQVTYTAPEISGEVMYRFGDCPGASNEFVRLLVKVEGLQPLGAGADHDLVGVDGNHSARWYGTPDFVASLVRLSFWYAQFFPGSKLGYNDMSLPWGGLFEAWSQSKQDFMGGPWIPPHAEHRLGTNVDVAVPAQHRNTLLTLLPVAGIGGTPYLHSSHVHVRF